MKRGNRELIRSLYKKTLKLGAALDSAEGNPAKRALLMGLPKKVWYDGLKTTIGLNIPKNSYHGILNEFTRGENFKPEGQSAVQSVKAAWRTNGGSVEVAFAALKGMKLVLDAGANLPAFKKKRTPKALKLSTMRINGKGKLLVGHPLASLLNPLLHRSLVLLTPTPAGSPTAKGFIMNRPSGKKLREVVHSSWGNQFGPLLKHNVWVAGNEGSNHLSVLHPWRDVPKSVGVGKGLYVLDLNEVFLSNDFKPLESIKEKISGKPPQSVPIKILLNFVTWDVGELQASLTNNHFLSLEQVSPIAPAKASVRKPKHQYIFSKSCSWHGALQSCSGEAEVLTAIPELTSQFGQSFKPLAEAHHQLIQTHVKNELERRKLEKNSKKSAQKRVRGESPLVANLA
eukprot:TRINITY_DN119_c2_g1_i2.p1 TRINITY_DN119_c2_g1~~TRINITY_DN119_c2_g1_i2.p1  ORF type:complete len:419 (+),score=63.17 TRINITY_DN119_c2_g1_i2:62-1258(+)